MSVVEQESPSAFFGRQNEVRWLAERLARRHHVAPIVVTGPAGVGKTALVARAINSAGSGRDIVSPLFLNLWRGIDVVDAVQRVVETLRTDTIGRYEPSIVVVLDGAEHVPLEELLSILKRVRNFKRVRAVILVARDRLRLPDADELVLTGLPSSDIESLVRSLLPLSASELTVADAIAAAEGRPRAANLLARLFTDDVPGQDVRSALLYGVEPEAASQSAELVAVAAPRIISATEALIAELRQSPDLVYEIHPRRFEELLAELLCDRGWDVQLTPATRDGGKDILAYLDTDVGRFLCLVEAKRYARGHKVGVELVRALYGTFSDYQANSAMLVTTSSFTAGAEAFQQKHPYQLSLKSYVHIGQWIEEYGDHKARSNSGF